MQIMQSRRDFLASAVAGRRRGRPWRAGIARRRGAAGDDHGPPDHGPGICIAPQYLAEELLRADGFTDVSFVPAMKGPPGAAMIGRGEADFTSTFAASVILPIDAGEPITALAGIHRGCYELFANERVQTIVDLKGKRVAVPALRSSRTSISACWRSTSGSILAATSSGSPAPPRWSCLPPGRSTHSSASRRSRRSCAREGSNG